MYAPDQWEMTLQSNVVSHWLVAYTKWSLKIQFFQSSQISEVTHLVEMLHSMPKQWKLDILFNSLFTLIKRSLSLKFTSQAPFERGIHLWLLDSPHKRPVMWKVLLCHDVMSLYQFSIISYHAILCSVLLITCHSLVINQICTEWPVKWTEHCG